ncbi:unnamed protein product [Effrenium voratum]|nr:unnamed protein product [Effrenium voratum]
MRLRRLHPAGHCVLLVSASLPALPEIHRRERLVSPLDKDAGREAVRAEALCCALQQDRARTGDSLRASAPDALTRPRCKPLRLACGDAPKVRGSCQNGVSSLDGIPSLEVWSSCWDSGWRPSRTCSWACLRKAGFPKELGQLPQQAP